MNIRIRIEKNLFNETEITNWLQSDSDDGAIVTFLGKVRADGNAVLGLYLEHYPGMTERVLRKIAQMAIDRWPVNKIAISHRIGEIESDGHIVFVGVSSKHRAAAFDATEYIMDVLKNEAPFWKKEKRVHNSNWVKVKFSDQQALKKWKT